MRAIAGAIRIGCIGTRWLTANTRMRRN